MSTPPGLPAGRLAAARSRGPSVLVAAVAPPTAQLVGLLGSQRAGALQRTLLARVTRWAAAVAPGRVRSTGENVAAAANLALAQGGGPLLVAWPVLPRWPTALAAGALDDLDDGCDVSIGPVFDGGLYLLALTRPAPAVLALLDAGGLPAGLDALQGTGLDVGLLRAERGLGSPADVRAALADPLLDADLRELLS